MSGNFDKPVFVLGLPRSGTSLVAGALGICGAWLGKTVPGVGSENPKGFFEHIALRENVNKEILRKLGCDPLGVTKLPGLAQIPEIPDFRETVHQILASEGYNDKQYWLLKDAKLTLLWPVYNSAFPKARWIIVRRSEEDIVRSCLNTPFMAQHSSEPEPWHAWVSQYLQRLEKLKVSCGSWEEIWPEDMVSGDYIPLQKLVEQLGLEWDESALRGFINKDYWHGSK